MKKFLFIFVLVLFFASDIWAQQYEYLQISAIESVVPGGLGRSRLITTDDKGQLMESNLDNFYSMVGINFKNIRNNDAIIMDKANELADNGWELFLVNSGVESSEGKTGIFITRYIFRRIKE